MALSAMVLIAMGLVGRTETQSHTEDLERQLRELEELYGKGLLTKEVYDKKLEELSRPNTGDGASLKEAPAAAPGLAGVWQVRVEGLSLWAPRQTLEKSIGMTFWRLSATRERLTLRQYVPEHGTYLPPDFEPMEIPFAEIEISEWSVDDETVAFETACAEGSAESYRLEQLTERRITGTYVVRDCQGGEPDSGPAYEGRLIMERVDSSSDSADGSSEHSGRRGF